MAAQSATPSGLFGFAFLPTTQLTVFGVENGNLPTSKIPGVWRCFTNAAKQNKSLVRFAKRLKQSNFKDLSFSFRGTRTQMEIRGNGWRRVFDLGTKQQSHSSHDQVDAVLDVDQRPA